jgi:protoporphyrinogen/coproporphyrinogen III oxidase
MPPHVVILGGGISGLAAAYVLRRCAQAPLRVTLVENSSRLGGWLHSFRSGGDSLFEAGGRGLRPRNGGIAGLRLVEDLGLQPFALPSSRSATTRFLLRGGSLQALPTSTAGALTSSLVRPVILSAWRDLLQSPCSEQDETVDSFVTRHLGPHAAQVLFNALLGGIYAGDSTKLSVRSVFPVLWDLQQAHGSLSRAIAAKAFRSALDRSSSVASTGAPSEAVEALFSEKLGPNPSEFISTCAKATSVSFTHGVSTLTHALEFALLRHGEDGPKADEAVRAALWPHPRDLSWLQRTPPPPTASERALVGFSQRGCEVKIEKCTRATAIRTSLSREGVDVHCLRDGDPVPVVLRADRVISALPASALAEVLEASTGAEDGTKPAISALRSIPFASVAAVNLAWRGHVKDAAKRGFGYLVPACERLDGPLPGVLGMVFDSDVFPGQARILADAATRRVHGSSILTDAGIPDPDTRVTVMIGGATWPDVSALSSDELISIAQRAARAHVGITSEPCEAVPNVAHSAIPQYTISHHERVAAAEDGVRKQFGGRVQIIGNSFRGVGISDCLSGAIAAADQVLSTLSPAASGAEATGTRATALHG